MTKSLIKITISLSVAYIIGYSIAHLYNYFFIKPVVKIQVNKDLYFLCMSAKYINPNDQGINCQSLITK